MWKQNYHLLSKAWVKGLYWVLYIHHFIDFSQQYYEAVAVTRCNLQIGKLNPTSFGDLPRDWHLIIEGLRYDPRSDWFQIWRPKSLGSSVLPGIGTSALIIIIIF